MRVPMSGSRGKGKRRVSWRDGGARKKKPVEWRHQAMHAVQNRADLGDPLVSYRYTGRYREKPAHAIYRLDQKIAPTGIPYNPEYQGRWRGFLIHVAAEHQETLRRVLAQLDAEE